MNTAFLLDHFRTHDAPLALSRAGVVGWDDADLHRIAYADDPEGYVLLALVPGVHPQQRARVLLCALSASRAGLDAATRDILDRAVRALIFGLPPHSVVTVLLALRRLRVNHKHTTRAVLTFVLEHPEAERLIAARRPALVDCFEHALGKVTARGCARRIAAGDSGSPELRRALLRFTVHPQRACARVAALYGPGTHGAPAPREPVVALEPPRVRPAVVTVTNRGDIAATLVHLYRGGSDPELRTALAGYVAAAAGDLPRLHATVALVLDTSDSLRGYGEREWALQSQAQALRLVLGAVCARLTVIEIGDEQRGPTDLATGLLDALDTAPDLVAVVTDGYENRYPGDLARVVDTLPRAGVETPIVLCRSLFTDGDDRARRDPAPALPHQDFWHQDDFAALLPWLFAHCPAGADWIRTTALRFLARHPATAVPEDSEGVRI
ncbi:hypothetical protein [Nocardia sp. CC227C]|uniref:hypothetical protein n=1 Tax=Nocardia sp. CC227C TaxID=3044562 RepID=UPI00278C0E56|nr:hypothetical protein [Nocardia sp. CC227C]